ncbi:FAD-dependent monooxygenase [Actinomadura rupiterrae]|uniref:FAD-dependent monooxygenase n=1 Tax=Actinomadura rupiterrae TaxID=559627 RepID=UPI0020A58C01|nr:FAD-dependent monooxygenase [Actinomadura rupiterrae]MCP2341063.1 2-polyprenyl-6-methoxyphenol hydroxylase-like FAD-dependent oxidoreductase [Actinomadura rupiterrae]
MDEHTPVLIVGGGLCGLSAATFLAWHGVPATVVERRSGTLLHPRARAVNPRAMETLRGVGLAPAVLAGRSRVYDERSQRIKAATLAGPELRPTSMAAPRSADGSIGVSPCPWAPIDQDRLEVLLRAHAAELGADVRFGTALRSVEPAGPDWDGGVLAKIEDARGVRTVHAGHVVAADGYRSPLRRRLGIGHTGPGALGGSANFTFTADLAPALRGRHLGVGHFDRPRPGTVLLPHDGSDRWVLGIPFDPSAGESLADFTPERCADMVREAVGMPDLDVTIVPQLEDGTTVLAYEVEAKVADRFRHGPFSFVGDAAHVVPPTGAFGASTGIQDAHNLAWKLAAVLRGHAGPGLLDSYEDERRRVALFTMEQALLQSRERTGRSVPLDPALKPVDTDLVVFGVTYRSSAVVLEDDLPAEVMALPPAQLDGKPGTRAPHVWVRQSGAEVSVLDLFQRRPVLLAASSGEPWARAAREAADEVGTEVDTFVVGRDVTEPAGRFASAYGLGPEGAVLVRPDGFVAWRSPGAPPEPAGHRDVLTRTLRRVLSL